MLTIKKLFNMILNKSSQCFPNENLKWNVFFYKIRRFVKMMSNAEPKLLILYKPCTVNNKEIENELLKILKSSGEIIATRTFDPSPKDRIEELYAEHKGKFFYPITVDLMTSTKLVANVLAPKSKVDDAGAWIKHVREEVIGATDPEKAAAGTFRNFVYKKTGESMEKSNKENRALDNGVHCSDSVESGKREVGIFFNDYKQN